MTAADVLLKPEECAILIVDFQAGLGFAVEDHGDLSVAEVTPLDDIPPDNARHYREIQRWIRTISARAYDLAKTGGIPIFLGGDHSLSMGSVNGVARRKRASAAPNAGACSFGPP